MSQPSIIFPLAGFGTVVLSPRASNNGSGIAFDEAFDSFQDEEAPSGSLQAIAAVTGTGCTMQDNASTVPSLPHIEGVSLGDAGWPFALKMPEKASAPSTPFAGGATPAPTDMSDTGTAAPAPALSAAAASVAVDVRRVSPASLWSGTIAATTAPTTSPTAHVQRQMTLTALPVEAWRGGPPPAGAACRALGSTASEPTWRAASEVSGRTMMPGGYMASPVAPAGSDAAASLVQKRQGGTSTDASLSTAADPVTAVWTAQPVVPDSATAQLVAATDTNALTSVAQDVTAPPNTAASEPSSPPASEAMPRTDEFGSWPERAGRGGVAAADQGTGDARAGADPTITGSSAAVPAGDAAGASVATATSAGSMPMEARALGGAAKPWLAISDESASTLAATLPAASAGTFAALSRQGDAMAGTGSSPNVWTAPSTEAGASPAQGGSSAAAFADPDAVATSQPAPSMVGGSGAPAARSPVRATPSETASGLQIAPIRTASAAVSITGQAALAAPTQAHSAPTQASVTSPPSAVVRNVATQGDTISLLQLASAGTGSAVGQPDRTAAPPAARAAIAPSGSRAAATVATTGSAGLVGSPAAAQQGAGTACSSAGPDDSAQSGSGDIDPSAPGPGVLSDAPNEALTSSPMPGAPLAAQAGGPAATPAPVDAKVQSAVTLKQEPPTPVGGALQVADNSADALVVPTVVSSGLTAATQAGAAMSRPTTAALDAAAQPAVRTTPASQISAALSVSSVGRASGTRRLSVTLAPKELGSIDISVERTASGTTAIRVVTERLDTLHLLRNDHGDLTRSLDQAGIGQDRTVSFSWSGGDGEKSAWEQDRGQQGGTPQRHAQYGMAGLGAYNDESTQSEAVWPQPTTLAAGRINITA